MDAVRGSQIKAIQWKTDLRNRHLLAKCFIFFFSI